MIDPRELRIGNYLYNLSTGVKRICKVIMIDREGYLELLEDGDKHNSYLDEDIQPIPLTKDIFAKCNLTLYDNIYPIYEYKSKGFGNSVKFKFFGKYAWELIDSNYQVVLELSLIHI